MENDNIIETTQSETTQNALDRFENDVFGTSTVYNTFESQESKNAPENTNGNVVAGVVGAFLFALLGGVLYFIIYQFGVIAGICGLVMFVLANFGYGLFAKAKNTCVAGIITSVIVTLVMIFVSEYVCISYEIFQAYKDYGITIFDAIVATPDFLKDPEILSAVGGDLLFAYLFGVVAMISSIVNMIKAKKNKK